MSSTGMRMLAGSRDREAIELANLIALRDLRNFERSGLRFADVPIVSFGSKADKLYVNAARPLHRPEQTNAEASLNVCVRPEAEERVEASPLGGSLASETNNQPSDRGAHHHVVCVIQCAPNPTRRPTLLLWCADHSTHWQTEASIQRGSQSLAIEAFRQGQRPTPGK